VNWFSDVDMRPEAPVRESGLVRLRQILKG
jgi:hypothetical protein